MDDKGKELCPRLIDYLVIVGRRSKSKCFSQPSIDGTPMAQTITKPELLRRYPTDDHKDFSLPTDVTVFCQPEGCFIKGASKHIETFVDMNSFVFTLTEKDSAKIRYGICQNFFQSFERPESTTSNASCINLEVNGNRKRRKEKRASLTSLCLMSHHPFFSAFRELLLLLKKLIDKCSQRVRFGDKDAKDSVWSALTGHWGDKIPSTIMREIRELETWILMILSAPVPVPGKTKLQLEIMPMHLMPIYDFALPDHTRFSLVDYPLHLPLELLGIDTVVKVLSAVMLEYKVVLQSRNYNAVSMCVLAIVALLYPLEYMFPVIPLLPTSMPSAEQLLFAPTPFIIGMPASFLSQKNFETVPNDVILVNLDTNEFVKAGEIEIPDIPEPELTNLKQSFVKSLSKLKLNVPNKDQQIRSINYESNYIADSDMIDIEVRVAMIRFFNSQNIFANFSEHTRTLRLYPRPVVTLQTDSFLRSRPSCSQFIIDLCRTQAVEYFAESSLCPRNEAYVRVQTGIDSPEQIGDKAKWFSESLMPVRFAAYLTESTLADVFREKAFSERSSIDESCGSQSEEDSCSSIDDLIFESPDETDRSYSASKPLGEVNDVYREPLKLELPRSESGVSVPSSLSSGRTTPSSSISTSAMDSEADFARLAENLAIKTDVKGDMLFVKSDNSLSENEKSNISNTLIIVSEIMSNSARKNVSLTKPSRRQSNSREKMLGPQFMSTLNDYALKSHDMLNQMLNRTAPKAQALRDKTVSPLAIAAATRVEQGQHLMKAKATTQTNSSNAASQQRKNQQSVREICDQVLSGHGVGVFAHAKLKRLMEDESLRQLVCSKLNLGLGVKHSEDDYIQEILLTRAQYKGYVKVLQSCIVGLEHSYNTPGSNGIASMYHVLEIAHTHYWARENDNLETPANDTDSQLSTPKQFTDSTDENFLPLGAKFDLQTNHSSMDGQGNQPTALPPRPVRLRRESNRLQFPTGPPPLLPPRPKRMQRHSNCEVKETTTRSDESVSVASTISESNSVNSMGMKSLNNSELVNEVKENHVAMSQPTHPTQLDSHCKTKRGPISIEVEQLRNTPAPPKTLPLPREEESRPQFACHYLYQDLILASSTPLWNKMSFWENVFCDIVGQERDIVGMDQEPSEMIDRYSSLSEFERRRLELDEDRLLATLLHNLTAYMVMCGTPHKAVQQKIRRLLGKAHIGLVYSKTINQLLDQLPRIQSNGIPLKPLGSRLMHKQSFTVYADSNNEESMMFLEVCDDAVVLRAITGAIAERWWYERIVNMTYSPKTKVLCLWQRHEGKVHMHKFYTKKCRELYEYMKSAMERAASRGKVSTAGRGLGGEFPVHDTASNEGGLLQVRIDGIALLFADRQHFIDLANIKKCNTFGGNVFILEEYDRKKNELVQRRFMSQMADQICYDVLCVFSFAAAGRNHSDKRRMSQK